MASHTYNSSPNVSLISCPELPFSSIFLFRIRRLRALSSSIVRNCKQIKLNLSIICPPQVWIQIKISSTSLQVPCSCSTPQVHGSIRITPIGFLYQGKGVNHYPAKILLCSRFLFPADFFQPFVMKLKFLSRCT